MQLNRCTLQKAIINIYDSLVDVHGSSYSLLGGFAGVTLFHSYAARSSNSSCAHDVLQRSFNSGLDAFAAADSHATSFGYGLAGYVWHLNELRQSEWIDFDDALSAMVGFSRKHIMASVLSDIEDGNIDLFTGAIGKLNALFPFLENEISVVARFVNYLHERVTCNAAGLFSLRYQDDYPAHGAPYVNTGLAHGIAGILAFCTRVAGTGLFFDQLSQISNVCMQFFLDQVNEDFSGSYVPAFIEMNPGRHPEKSRLAWCYGDLSLGYTLLVSEKTFGNPAVRRLAEEMLRHCTKRRTPEETQIIDAGICHGSSGVAHLFHKVWRITGEPVFHEAAQYWIRRTLDFAVVESGRTVYKRFSARSNSFHADSGLLMGMAGIGLVLHSWLTGDYSWDSCLLL